MHLSMLQGVGMMPGLLAPSTDCCRRSCRLDTTWSLTRLSRKVLVGALGRYARLFRQVRPYQTTQMNSPMFSHSTVNSSHSDNLRNGECVHCKVHSVVS